MATIWLRAAASAPARAADEPPPGVETKMRVGFFSGCFGGCYLETDACYDANFDQVPTNCVGTGDFAPFAFV